jgi:hypothetical protein
MSKAYSMLARRRLPASVATGIAAVETTVPIHSHDRSGLGFR